MRHFRSCRSVVHFGAVVALISIYAPFGEGLCENSSVDDTERNHDQNMNHWRPESLVICKGIERVDGGVGDDAGKQTSATIIDRYKQEANCNGKDDLA